ncbi:MAG: hypothetical protein A3F82_01370 [Deltaproteobacteria bacterium RIFCSPLOWO2_12_FULL_44_12]|nr:MAG: hypothetical protein A2712_03590 [Deltaproteobacteria bacterium RIFCSPHIGHO2_01_FULL_43_49]OGQ16275.1 MAG: hypothetical protein A3D22_01560 [Deltaproteobacteria bacterium RIFCSPHIGHO2_02_FULL_44_53]OGQ29235.1 MAG: hypothetical protein A3D98_05345 [Deltaproteobacteria bacterium RIFCSPHIGHO2_12_FULL_44_21]OGQ32792.1 MAG: hypothetical protein A2979_09490 [Deltaproteobacteria bacterium RIFCSPLOWO2_01_FULL_45_74]OGQ41893.1 MAG: hypothetical protein A3I70_09275 [Deltaproteobacteria bacterium 
MRKLISWGGWGILSLLLVQATWAADLEWLDKSTIVVDDVFQLIKPDPKWDTQKVKQKEDPYSPVKWILHQAGRNPTIRLKYATEENGLMGKTAHLFAEQVKTMYKGKGVFIQSVEKKVINGRHVALMHGMNPGKDERYLIGVWRHQNKGFILECSSKDEDFNALLPQFKGTIETARILKER